MEMPDFSDMAGMGRAFRIHRQLISPNRLFVSFFVVVVCVCVYFIIFFFAYLSDLIHPFTLKTGFIIIISVIFAALKP